MTQLDSDAPTHALSIQSPWAFLIAHKIKLTENRTNNLSKELINKWIAIQVGQNHYEDYEKVFDKNIIFWNCTDNSKHTSKKYINLKNRMFLWYFLSKKKCCKNWYHTKLHVLHS